MKRIIIITAAAITVVFAAAAFAQGQGRNSISADVGLQWDVMQIMHSTDSRVQTPNDSTWLNHLWMQSVLTLFNVRANIGENLQVRISCFGDVDFTLPQFENGSAQTRTSGGGLDAAYATYHVGGADTSALGVTVGMFKFDYMYPWQCLGGYFFRTGVYPGYIISSRYEPKLTGIHASFQTPSWFRHDLFFLSESDPPAYDMTLAYLGRIYGGRQRVIEADVGVMLYRLLRTDQGNYNYTLTQRVNKYVDPATNDTTVYREAGIKGMARVCLNARALFNSERLGENDLRLYAEAALLGAQNFPGYYNKISERVPVTIGLTLPVFKLLDDAGVEGEWYGSRWKNNPTGVSVPYETFIPNADGSAFTFVSDPANEDAGAKAHTDNIKWAVFAEKTIYKKLLISLHVASDHFRAPDGGGFYTNELLHAPDEWYWQLSLRTKF